MQVKIGDFGLACIGNLNDDTQLTKSSSVSSADTDNLSLVVNGKDSNEHTKGVGTSLYASPEQLKGKVYDTKVIYLVLDFENGKNINFILFLLFPSVTCLV